MLPHPHRRCPALTAPPAAHPARLHAVSCLAYTCHFNLLPIKASLKNPTADNMSHVVKLSLVVCTFIFASIAVSGERASTHAG